MIRLRTTLVLCALVSLFLLLRFTLFRQPVKLDLSHSVPPQSLVTIHNQSATASKDKKPVLKLNTQSLGCPTPRAALIGIFTVAGADAATKRQLLREKYRLLNAELPEAQKIDFVFFFGNANSYQKDYELAVEETLFPTETVVIEALEDRDSGKILEWFKYARTQLYVRHPRLQNEWCLRYRFVGKGDDDAVFHLPRLSKMLIDLPTTQSHYVGRNFADDAHGVVPHMTGMLNFVSADIVEWINFSPIPPANVNGIEDVKLGTWLHQADFEFNRLNKGLLFHDLYESPMFSPAPTTPNSLVIHWCKDNARMFKCLTSLFDEDRLPQAVAYRLTRPTSIKNRLRQFGVLNSTTSSDFQQASDSLHALYRDSLSTVTLKQIDTILLKPIISQIMTNMSVTNASPSSVTSVIDDVSVRIYLSQREAGDLEALAIDFVLRDIIIPEMKLYLDWGQSSTAARWIQTLLSEKENRRLSRKEVETVVKDVLGGKKPVQPPTPLKKLDDSAATVKSNKS
ncbi:hypothetical protein BDR26DRAFT_871754, partial [Obelidium mucronatum]